LGVTQKTAWFMLHRIWVAMRLAASTSSFPARSKRMKRTWAASRAGNVGWSNMHPKGSGHRDKAVVMGMIERGAFARSC
jgi:hypothetical protein